MSKTLSEPALDSFQKWFQTFIVEPGQADDAVAAAQRISGLRKTQPEDLIKPSERLTALERLMIYRNQYLLRMEEALATDFPILQQHLGSARFFALVEEYVQVHPSRSHTLNDLGLAFPDYILKARGLKRKPLLHDLCRVEWLLSAILDEDEVPSLSRESIAAVAPESWSEARLTTIPSLRLIELKYPIQDWLNAHRDDQPLPEIRPKQSWLMFWRHDDSTWRMPLDRPRFEFMQRLQEGMTVASAIDEVLTRRKVQPHRLFAAFSEWLGEGLFCGLQLPD